MNKLNFLFFIPFDAAHWEHCPAKGLARFIVLSKNEVMQDSLESITMPKSLGILLRLS